MSSALGDQVPGQRICVVGTSGSGKSYVAQALAERLGLPYVENDALIWRPGWEPVPDEERLPAFEEATAGNSWTFDGNLSLRRPEDRLVLDRCDTVVWLDLPRWQVHSQVVLRSFRRLLTRERLFHGNVERWSTLFSSDSIVWWSIKTFSRRRSEYGRVFADPAYAAKTRIRLTSRREVASWLQDLRCRRLLRLSPPACHAGEGACPARRSAGDESISEKVKLPNKLTF